MIQDKPKEEKGKGKIIRMVMNIWIFNVRLRHKGVGDLHVQNRRKRKKENP